MKISKDTKVGDVFRRYPRAAPILIAQGICDCCGGDFTLEQSAAQRGLDLDTLLSSLEKAISSAYMPFD